MLTRTRSALGCYASTKLARWIAHPSTTMQSQRHPCMCSATPEHVTRGAAATYQRCCCDSGLRHQRQAARLSSVTNRPRQPSQGFAHTTRRHCIHRDFKGGGATGRIPNHNNAAEQPATRRGRHKRSQCCATGSPGVCKMQTPGPYDTRARPSKCRGRSDRVHVPKLTSRTPAD